MDSFFPVDTEAPSEPASAATEPAIDDCIDEITPPLAWFASPEVGTCDGSIDFGQTHVIRELEERIAPPLIEDCAP